MSEKTNQELIAIAQKHVICSCCRDGWLCLPCVMRTLADRLEAADQEITRLRGLIAWAWDNHGQNMALVCDEEIELETIWAEESAKKREGEK